MLANFAELTRRWQGRTGHRPRRLAGTAVPRARTATPPDSGRTRQLEVLVERLPGTVAAEAVFERLFSRSAYAFWLDSGLREHESAQYSFMGDASGPLSRRVYADVWTGEHRIP